MNKKEVVEMLSPIKMSNKLSKQYCNRKVDRISDKLSKQYCNRKVDRISDMLI